MNHNQVEPSKPSSKMGVWAGRTRKEGTERQAQAQKKEMKAKSSPLCKQRRQTHAWEPIHYVRRQFRGVAPEPPNQRASPLDPDSLTGRRDHRTRPAEGGLKKKQIQAVLTLGLLAGLCSPCPWSNHPSSQFFDPKKKHVQGIFMNKC